MLKTPKLQLNKPEGTDVVNIEDLNANMDKLDTEVTKLATTSVDGRMSKADKTKLNGLPSGAEFTQIKNDLTTHLADDANPHSVTKVQVGLGSVQNFGIATQSESEAGMSDAKYMTPLKTAQAIEALASFSNSQTFTENGTFTVPKGVTSLYITACGGGGGGSTGEPRQSGGGGACIIRRTYTVTPLSTLTVTVGKGGLPDQNGTATIISPLVTLNGGGRGVAGGGASGGQGGGRGSNGNNNDAQDGAGGKGGEYGGGGSYGGGGGGSQSNMAFEGGAPINSAYSNGGSGQNGTTTRGGNGAYGGGGGGRRGTGTSGSGGNGIVIIEW